MQAQYMKKESLILGPKLLYLGISRLTFDKKLFPRVKQPQIFQIARFHEKLKIHKSRTKILFLVFLG